MAEIKIEKKPPVWPWILAAIIILGLLTYFFVLKDDDDKEKDVAATDTEQVMSDGQDGAVAEYVAFVSDQGAMGLDHEFTKNAFIKLRKAIEAKAEEEDYDVSADLGQIDEHINHITTDPYETTHANHIRKGSEVLTNAMQNLQQAKFPDLTGEMQAVRQASNSIDPNALTLDQRNAVKSFFDTSADLLQKMN